jgi:hypothetical protein
MSEEPKEPAWARCDKCQHIFTYAYLPMEIAKVVPLMQRLSCPMCANTDGKTFFFCESPFLEDENK